MTSLPNAASDGARLLDPSAMAKYGTQAREQAYNIEPVPYGSPPERNLASSPESGWRWRYLERVQEQPSFWGSVFSSTRKATGDYRGVDSLTNTVIEEYTPVPALGESQDQGPGSSINFAPEPEDTAGSNFWWSTFNLWNDILSCNIVSLPFFVASLGLWMTFVVFILYGLLTVHTLDAVYKLSKKHRKNSYVELCQYSLGKPGYLAACFSIFMFNYGGLIANLLIIATNVPEILQQFIKPHIIWISREWILMYICCLFLPFAFFKNITSYTINSVLSLASVWILSGIVFAKLIYTYAHDHKALPSGLWEAFGPAPLSAIGGVSYLYVCHDLSFSVFEDYKGVTRRRWSRVILTAIGLTLIPWLLTGISGFILFGADVSANVLDNFPIDDIPAIVARFALSLNVAISVPYYCFMPRLSLYALLTLLFGKVDVDVFHIMATTCIMVSAFLFAIFITDLGTFSELVGVAAISLGLILPPLMFLRLERGVWYSPGKLTHGVILGIGVLSALGVLLTIVLTKVTGRNV